MAKQTFTTGQVLTAAQMTSLQQTAMGGGSATAKTASYTLVAADAGTTVIMNSASPTTITVNTSLFAAGDTVFIVNQGAGACTITAGTATVSTAGSLAMAQNETGELYFLSTSAAIFSEYTQAAATPGKIAQILQTVKTDTFTSTSASFVDITGLSVTITPTSATSTIMVMMTVVGANTQATSGSKAQVRLMRGATAIGIADAAGSAQRSTGYISSRQTGTANVAFTASANFIDSPATTSATTYKVQGIVGGGTFYINRDEEGDTTSSTSGRFISTITVMEITA